MTDDLISRRELKNTLFKVVEPSGIIYAADIVKIIDNAPTVLHDNYSMGYQDGVKKILSERSQGEPDVNCSHCDYWKFSQAIINGFVDLMAARGIESIEELEEELHRLNQNKQEDAENE